MWAQSMLRVDTRNLGSSNVTALEFLLESVTPARCGGGKFL